MDDDDRMEEELTDDDPLLSILGGARPGPWVEKSLCKQTDPEIFFPERGGRLEPALTICGRCEVRKECLEYSDELEKGLSVWGIHGVYGGLTRQGRIKRRKELGL